MIHHMHTYTHSHTYTINKSSKYTDLPIQIYVQNTPHVISTGFGAYMKNTVFPMALLASKLTEFPKVKSYS